MQLSIKGKQINVGDSLRAHVEEQLNEIIGKFFSGSQEASVTFSREAHLFCADIVVHAGRGIVLQSNGSASEPYPAFDQAAERMAERLRRNRKRLKRHHQEEAVPEAKMVPAFVLEGDEEKAPGTGDNPVIVAEMTTPIETLSVSEAVMRLDLGDLPALLFKNKANQGLNMIYRRADGHIGWVDPAQTLPASKAKG
jgi:ribosomal subunit interface protein